MPQPTATAPTAGVGSVYGSPKQRRKWSLAKILLVTMLVGIGTMWVYAFMFAPSASPEKIADRAWVAEAERVCAVTKKNVGTLKTARSFKDITPRSEALRLRADEADKATAYVRDLVRTLRLTTPTDAHGASVSARWLTDWDTYIGDRDAHVAQYRAGLDPPFAQTVNEIGAPIPIRMNQFARTNGMPSCEVPLDLG